MPKKRNSEGLFEVIAKARDSQEPSLVNVPEWMSRKPPEQQTEAGVEGGGEAEAEQPPPRPVWTRLRRLEIPRRLLAVRDARVTLSLNFVSCAVVALALATLLVSMFVIGWKWGAGSASAGRPAVPRRPDVLGKKNLRRTVARAELPERVAGKYYMLIQGLDGVAAEHWTEAKMIVDFCNKAKLPADIGQMRDPKRLVVWSLTGFDSPDGSQAQKYAQQIKALGQKYKAERGTYEFRQADPVGNWPVFHQYRPRR